MRLTEYGNDWKLRDFLDSIAEINNDYLRCYDKQFGKICMLDVFDTPEGTIEKIYYSPENLQELQELLSDVEGFTQSYLTPVSAQKDGDTYYVLRHKLSGEIISETSYSGQPYLQAAHRKSSKLITIPTVINMYVALFTLASLCRYHPRIWNPFVQRDATGEKLLIEKLMFYTRRMVPNFVLNHIMGQEVRYTSNRYNPQNTVKLIGEHQVKDIVQKEVRRQFREDQIRKGHT